LNHKAGIKKKILETAGKKQAVFRSIAS